MGVLEVAAGQCEHAPWPRTDEPFPGHRLEGCDDALVTDLSVAGDQLGVKSAKWGER